MTAAAFTASGELVELLRRWRTRLLGVGIVALLVCAAGAFFQPAGFLRSYLWGYLFFLGVALGCLAYNMLQYLTGGAWGMVIRRLCDAAVRTFPLLAVLFLPIAFGIPHLYDWSHPEVVAADHLLKHKSAYLNVPFFLIRAAVYFAGWMLLAWGLNRWSRRQDEGSAHAANRLRKLSAPGLVFYVFSVTFMGIDWVMSISPHWFSTMFGLLFVAGQGLSAMAFLIVMLVLFSRFQPFAEVITAKHLHDLGKLLLTFVMVWAYFSFSQWLIIWAGNLPEEIPWYLERLRGGWQFVALALILLHFALPFLLLLSRDLKRNFRLLTAVALLVLAMRLVDLFWLVAPGFRKGGLAVSWMDFLIPIGLGCLWLSYFAWQLPRRPLLPLSDPELEEALQHGRE
ncbi:MAG: hypothetical protein ACE15B_09990 [Bryobacteraceae bacterium]